MDTPTSADERPGRSWAIASLVLAILAVPGTFVPPAGIYLGLAAVVGAILARRRGASGGMTGAALGIGAAATILATYFGIGLCGPSILWMVCAA